MAVKVTDWKEIVTRYHEKAVTLAILILLFAFLVAPKLEVQPYKVIRSEFITVESIPDIKDSVPPPSTVIKPEIELVFDDSFDDEDPDLMFLDTIDPTTLDPYDINTGNQLGSTKKIKIFEDPPVPFKQIMPQYTNMARNVELEGIVGLEVEVFADGKVGAIEVKQSLQAGPGGLDNEAIKAVKQWEFQPARSNGNPIAVWTYIEIEFRLE